MREFLLTVDRAGFTLTCGIVPSGGIEPPASPMLDCHAMRRRLCSAVNAGASRDGTWYNGTAPGVLPVANAESPAVRLIREPERPLRVAVDLPMSKVF
ncbi:hypothetical protein GB931_00320 [Modestobacter sp. I12A-02628]|uniref:Uncharacterized protein n=1 Tax=Goekera deserti TaxID=2497753 RepID=A0A7K3WIB9_9ACTN|nr:hypothetical protein [Goekera deserti]MPQ96392.1 hypothetical protein [Goekera deserti]NDI47296.1 hypothetical protein [Goekera deserti]NEL56126.1 hypothetical protein [Goekera deserti]